jgi:flagellar protein FliS
MQLVVMLYDGAITAIAKAALAMDGATPEALETVHRELTRAQDILVELQLSLDHEQGGPIAASLDGIYRFCLERLTSANVSKNAEPLRAVTSSLTELREAWAEAASSLAVAS